MAHNKRLLISVYDAQEAREAVVGGARVVDCEDPAGALGDISPRKVMDVVDAVLGYQRGLDVQISTNIGENQMSFKRDENGRALERYSGEIAGKAAQAALGVAAAMGTEVHPVNIVKVGLDGMPVALARETLAEVVSTLNRNSQYSRSQVVAVFFAQDLRLWRERRSQKTVIRDLLLSREYFVDPARGHDIAELFKGDVPALEALKAKLGGDPLVYDQGTLRRGVKLSTTELHERKLLGFSDDPLQYLQQVAELTRDAGADGVMIDTRIHSKVARLCCLDAGISDPHPALPLRGIYTLDQLGQYAQLCHALGIEFWASGGVQPNQASLLWGVEEVDGMAVRSGASGPARGASAQVSATAGGVVSRGSKRIYRDLVSKYAPP